MRPSFENHSLPLLLACAVASSIFPVLYLLLAPVCTIALRRLMMSRPQQATPATAATAHLTNSTTHPMNPHSSTTPLPSHSSRYRCVKRLGRPLPLGCGRAAPSVASRGAGEDASTNSTRTTTTAAAPQQGQRPPSGIQTPPCSGSLASTVGLTADWSLCSVFCRPGAGLCVGCQQQHHQQSPERLI